MISNSSYLCTCTPHIALHWCNGNATIYSVKKQCQRFLLNSGGDMASASL